MIAVLVFFVAPATLSFFTYAWSEALFVPLLLAAIWLAVCLASPPSARVDPDAANRPVPSRSHPIHAVLLAATLMALVYTRYAGIAFAILLPLGWWLSPDRRRLFRSFFLASLGYAAGVGILLARNYAVARSLTGESRAASRHGIAANLADLIRCLIPPCPDALLTTVAGASLALLAVGMRLLPLKSSGLNPALSQSRDASIRMGLSLAAAAGYLSYLVLLRSLKQFDRIDIRLTGVVLPLLIVALAVAARRAWDRRRRVRIVDLSALALAAAVAGVELRQGWLIYRRALSDWELRWSPSMPAGPNLVYTNHTLPPGQNYFKAVTGRLAPLRGGVIVTDRPDPVHFHTDLPVRQFPESSLTPELIRTINAVGGKGCVLLQRADMIGRLTGLYRERGRTLDLDADAMRQYGILLVPLPLPDVTAPP
jgi:hypothetical protein